MNCELCKTKKAEVHYDNEWGTLDICFPCLFDIQTGLGYYIAGTEVVKEEWDDRTKEE